MDNARTLNYRRPELGAAAADRWSVLAVCSLIFSLAACPPVLDWILAGELFEPLDGGSRFILGCVAAVLTAILSLAAALRIPRNYHFRGMRFALPAVIISCLTCGFHALILLIHGPN